MERSIEPLHSGNECKVMTKDSSIKAKARTKDLKDNQGQGQRMQLTWRSR